MRIEQNELSVATAAAAALNAEFVTKGIDGDIIALEGQIDRYFVSIIPKPRQAEFEAATTIVQNKFSIITANANDAKYFGTSYVDAWEAEYLIMFP